MLSDEGDSLVYYKSLRVPVVPKVADEMLMRMYMMWGEKYGYKIKKNFQRRCSRYQNGYT
jgi:peptide chain release factor 2